MIDSPTGRWTIFSAPSDECTINEIRDEDFDGFNVNNIIIIDHNNENVDHEQQYKKAHSQVRVNSSSADGLTKCNVQINTMGLHSPHGKHTRNTFGGMMTTASTNNRDGSSTASPAGLTTATATTTGGGGGIVVNDPIFPKWTQFTHFIHTIILSFVVSLSVHAAKHPKSYVFGTIVVSLTLISSGFFTNFSVNTDEQIIYAPFKSKSKSHANWIDNESGFPGNVRPFTVNVHADGDNIMSATNIRRTFDVLDEIRSTPGYIDVCAQGDYINFNDETTCKVMSVTRFFQHDVSHFDKIYNEEGEEGIAKAISADTYENYTPVDTDMILGNNVRDENGLITSIQSYKLYFLIANEEGVEELEARLLERGATLQEFWDNDTNPTKLEYFSMRSYSDEFARAIEKDLPLLPVVFFLMSGFTCLVFFRCDRVQSRSLLGIGCVVTILLALMSSFGIMFIIGVPFTSMTQLLPFVVFGIGLDDTFIITGAYFRTDPNKSSEDRIRETMEEIGLSITVTTVTTMFAFVLGCISTIPAIYWLNLYAFPTVVIDFLFQITFFVALIVLDERRIQANRMDCCCTKVNGTEEQGSAVSSQSAYKKTVAERAMGWYAQQLLRPSVKAVVIVGFIGYACFCAYTTSLMQQEFDFADLLPSDSYVKDFLDSMEAYSSRMLGLGIYFRGDFNQMDPEMQQQMKNYIDELSALPQLSDDVPFCWFRDFEDFKNSSIAQSAGLENMTLAEQIEYAFTVPAIKETYGKHVVRDKNGTIVASRCYTYLENLDLNVVNEQIDFLKAQREITARQPINQGKDEWSFFMFDRMYFLWEFYAVAVEELIFTTISGVIAVCAVGFFFFPRWKAMFFLGPLIIMLYINLLGTLQWAGLHINAVTYICLVISIGLMVDFIVHVLLRYYESEKETREERVKDTLETMGASILVGGISTALGVLPLCLSTSNIMNTVFISFFAMIVLGVTHGLVFLPVVLSICGPIEHFATNPLEGTGDLALKPNGESDTDESDDSDEDDQGVHYTITHQLSSQGFERELSTDRTMSNDSLRRRPGVSMSGSFDSCCSSSQNRNRPDHVLDSSQTFKDESLEVVRWTSTMALI